jgi:DNA polymerase (family 10)
MNKNRKGGINMVESHLAQSVAEEVVNMIKPHVRQILICGSLRRNAPEVHDIDIVVADPNEKFRHIMDEMKTSGGNLKYNMTCKGILVDVTVTTTELWGSAIMHFTGSKEFNIICRVIAKQNGMKLSQNGLVDATTGHIIASKDELSIFKALGIRYVAPANRDGNCIVRE